LVLQKYFLVSLLVY